MKTSRPRITRFVALAALLAACSSPPVTTDVATDTSTDAARTDTTTANDATTDTAVGDASDATTRDAADASTGIDAQDAIALDVTLPDAQDVAASDTVTPADTVVPTDVVTPSDTSPGPCRGESDCSPGNVCHLESCDGAGVCRSITACSDIFAPQCGCDGRTYSNECQRHLNSVGLLHDGPCTDGGTTDSCIVPPGRGCCKTDDQCSRGARCVGAGPCAPGETTTGVCKDPPAMRGACWDDRDCAAGERCSGATVCPCGLSCIIPDRPGTCASPL